MNAILEAGLFPSIPALTGFWQPIYLEPIVLSGERITIACAAYAGSEADVSQCLSEQLLDCLYGKKAPEIQNMITWVIESAKSELRKANNLSAWIPPFAGVIAGDKVKAHDDSINGLLHQAFRMTASLSQMAMDVEAEEEEVPLNKPEQQWPTRIIENMRLINPKLLQHFHQTVELKNKSKVKYGFIDGYCAINFGLLDPSRLSSTVQNTKAKIFDLQLLKNLQNLIPFSTYAIVLSVPRTDDPYVTPKVQKRIAEQITNIQDQAKQIDINLKLVHSAQEAAEKIIEITKVA